MVKYINEVTREYDIEHHILRNWEEKGYLGVVERDFTHGRTYDEEQLERIKVIQEVVNKQRQEGKKRTDFKEVERALLDNFGGEVQERPKNVPATPQAFENLIMKMENQDQKINHLQQLVLDLTENAKELKQSSSASITEDKANQLLSQINDEKTEKEEMKNEMGLLKEKLDIAVNYIQEQENQEKKGFWKRIFG